jgi:hypothetical protein
VLVGLVRQRAAGHHQNRSLAPLVTAKVKIDRKPITNRVWR